MATLNGLVAERLRRHMRGNAATLEARSSRASRLLRHALWPRRFAWFVAAYALIDVAAVAVEAVLGPGMGLPDVGASGMVAAAPGVAITAQTGVLAVITLAIALVGLLVQREEAGADIRIYYHESLAFETTASSLALVAVLAVQTVWPLQSALHSLAGMGDGPSFELPLTLLHLVWLCVNVAAGWNFVAVTLRFVQRSSRAGMRERYVAGVLLPAELRRRLRESLYQDGPPGLAGDDGARAALGLSAVQSVFGLPMPRGRDEVVLRLDAPKALTDVRFGLLAWAIERWRSRAAAAAVPGDGEASPTIKRLSFPVQLDRPVEGTITLCTVTGDTPLRRSERLAIRRAFVFSDPPGPSDLPTVEQIVEEQRERVVERMRRRALSSFDAELADLVRIHRFLIESGRSGDDVNLVEVSGSDWFSPHERLLRQYRPIFDVAAEMLAVDGSFIGSAAGVVPMLLARDGADRLSPGVVQDILRLGPMLMYAVERWVAPRVLPPATSGAAAATLAAADRRILAHALPEVVGAWEGLLARSSLGLRGVQGEEPGDAWERYRSAWPFLRRHLQGTAQCLAAAVWVGDEEGAALFRSSLARWPDSALFEMRGMAELKYRRLLMPEVFDLSWAEAAALVGALSYDHMPPPDPEGVLARAVRAVQRDVLLATAMVFLLWQASGRAPSGLPGATTRALLNGDDLRRDGAPGLPPRDALRTIADLLRLQAAGMKHLRGSHGAWLDELVRGIDDLTEAPWVPGRIYSPSTLHGRDGLAIMEAALVASAATTAPERMAEAFDGLARDAEALSGGDRMLRDAVRKLDGWGEALASGDAVLATAVGILSGAPSERAAFGGSALRAASAAIGAVRADRLRALPIASSRVEPLQIAAEAALLEGPDYLPFFRGVARTRDDAAGTATTAVIRDRLGKGALVEPDMDYGASGFAEVVASGATGLAARLAVAGFARRPRRAVAIGANPGSPDFWAEVAILAAGLGGGAVLLLSHAVRTRELGFTRFSRGGTLEGLGFSFDHSGKEGRGAHVATVGDVEVFTAAIPDGQAWLFRADMLRGVEFRKVAGDNLVQVSFTPDPPELVTGRLSVAVAPSFEWTDAEVIQLDLPRHDAVSAPEAEDVSGAADATARRDLIAGAREALSKAARWLASMSGRD